MKYTMNNKIIVGIKIVAIWTRQMILLEECMCKVARLDENPKNMPRASLNCHVDKRFPNSILVARLQFGYTILTAEVVRGNFSC